MKTTENIDGVYKIGRTKDFQERLKSHQSSHPEKLDISFVYETDNVEEVENCLKHFLKNREHRKRKEFYEIDIDTIKNLALQCDCMHMKIRRKSIIKDPNCKYIIHILKQLSTPEKNPKILYDSSSKKL
jgi:uncharacterized membrane-anchored protein YjiN (DUF445 family)